MRPPSSWTLSALDELSGLARRGDSAELLEHAQVVDLGPAFHDSAVGEAVDGNPRHRYLLASRGDAHQLSGVRASEGPAPRDLIPLGGQVIDRGMAAGEGRLHGQGCLLEALLGALRPRLGSPV